MMNPTSKPRTDRLSWRDVKDRIDLAAVATGLLGQALKRSGKRLLWRCPFHDDHDPSFQVEPERGRWKCWPCDRGGDAAALVMLLEKVDFPEAVRRLAHQAGVVTPSGRPAKAPWPSGPPSRARDRSPVGLKAEEARDLVEQSIARLWSPEGREALAYRLSRVKIRQPDSKKPRYVQVFGDRPVVYSGIEAIRPGLPLVAVQGELDALLLGQQLEGLASVITPGSASDRPDRSARAAMALCRQWYAAHDADESGDRAAAAWSDRATRVRPPAPKDWTDARMAGFDLRRWWIEEHFIDAFDREELAAIVGEGCGSIEPGGPCPR